MVAQVHVELTVTANYDVALHSINHQTVERVCNQLKQLPYSEQDEILGLVSRREINGWTVMFSIAHFPEYVLVRVMRLERARKPGLGPRAMKALELLGKIRGGFGV